ncbi:MAG: DNA methyltransferase [Acidimicrobiaceae bacterium]|nr:DNA methyltransferase [Acidimicrobiaceae bacterium]
MVADPAGAPNFLNRTLWIDDNLKVLSGINSECVDLVSLDPPFNSKRIYHAPLGSKAAGASFADTWTLDGVKTDWADVQEAADPAVYHTVVGAGLSAGESMQAYLTFMAPRLLELHRVLKPTGSLYLHCDPTASHYLKQLLDCVFGRTNFRNEIIWAYTGPGNTPRDFKRKHDTILRYVKSRDFTFNLDAVRVRHKRTYPSGGMISLAAGGRTRDEIHARETDLISRGKAPEDWWTDIGAGSHMSKIERTGWPTQKPLALLDRIIGTSSNQGDVVLDPFCGCGTACIAAEKLGRQWLGIDIDTKAAEVTMDRLARECGDNTYTIGEHGPRQGKLALADGDNRVFVNQNPPVRTDPDRPTRSPRIRTIRWHELGTGARRPCPGCDRPKYFDDFDLDQIQPRAKGGLDTDDNLQLLCSSCNRIKGQRLTMTELRQRLQTEYLREGINA